MPCFGIPVILHLQLPNQLPSTGADIRLRFRRVPEHSYVAHARLSSPPHPPVELGTSYIYGRGAGSNAQEQISIHVGLDAAVAIAAGDRAHVLEIEIEELSGAPVRDASVLEMVDWELVARP